MHPFCRDVKPENFLIGRSVDSHLTSFHLSFTCLSSGPAWRRTRWCSLWTSVLPRSTSTQTPTNTSLTGEQIYTPHCDCSKMMILISGSTSHLQGQPDTCPSILTLVRSISFFYTCSGLLNICKKKLNRKRAEQERWPWSSGSHVHVLSQREFALAGVHVLELGPQQFLDDSPCRVWRLTH